MSQIHVCSPCGLQFKSEAEYLEHQCSKASNEKPTSEKFLKNTTMPNYDDVAKASLNRGKAKAKPIK